VSTVALSAERFDSVEEGLKNVIDPELGVNIVDLGLIYDLSWDDEEDALIISMTLTSAGCPLTDVIEEEMARPWMASWSDSESTGSGCRRGVRNELPLTGVT